MAVFSFSIIILVLGFNPGFILGLSRKRAYINENPFLAIYHPNHSLLHFCGAVIVHQRFLLSAAHCFFAFHHYRPHVTVGTDSLLKRGQSYEIMDFFLHPLWNSTTMDYDILVIRTKRSLVFNQRVWPIKMVGPEFVIKEGEALEAMGFGTTTEKMIASVLVHKVNLLYYASDKCNEIYRHVRRRHSITKNMLCARGNIGENTCKGDSGGPLVYKGLLVGITSFGVPHKRCAQRSEPGVFTRISALWPFIDNVIKNHYNDTKRALTSNQVPHTLPYSYHCCSAHDWQETLRNRTHPPRVNS